TTATGGTGSTSRPRTAASARRAANVGGLSGIGQRIRNPVGIDLRFARKRENCQSEPARLGWPDLENDVMANLYKKPVAVIDPKTGKKTKGKSKKWWGRYRDENGEEKRVPLATDKSAAQTMLNEAVRKAERKAAG